MWLKTDISYEKPRMAAAVRNGLEYRREPLSVATIQSAQPVPSICTFLTKKEIQHVTPKVTKKQQPVMMNQQIKWSF
jgi:hypothetical protein